MGKAIRPYRLNVNQCLALEFYRHRHDVKITLSNLPYIQFIRCDSTQYELHIDKVVAEFQDYAC